MAEAIFLIPGFAREERGKRLQILLDNMTAVSARHPVTGTEPFVAPGLEGTSLTVGTDGRRVDVFEAYWTDLTVPQVTEDALQRAIRGLGLLVYWFVSPVWLALGRNLILTLGLLSSGVMLIFWYLTIIIVAAEVLASDTVLDPNGALGPFAVWIKAAANWVAGIGDWKYFVVLVSFLGAAGADRMASVAAFCKDYLQDAVLTPDIGLRSRIGQRVRLMYGRVAEQGYDRITVIGYSFGAAVAVDLLSDYPDDDVLKKTRFVTWGAPLVPMVWRSRWMRDEVDALLEREALAVWDDFHSWGDQLSAPIPGHTARIAASRPHWRSENARLDANLLDVLLGRSHGAYFHRQEMIEDILGYEMPEVPTPEAEPEPDLQTDAET